MRLVVTGLLAASALSLFMVTGCQSGSSKAAQSKPSISASSTRKDMMAGESIFVTAQTMNLVGAKEVHWSVTPNTGKLQPQGPGYQSALFTADQPGVYVITATADTGDGRMVSADTSVTVNSRGPRYTSEK